MKRKKEVTNLEQSRLNSQAAIFRGVDNAPHWMSHYLVAWFGSTFCQHLSAGQRFILGIASSAPEKLGQMSTTAYQSTTVSPTSPIQDHSHPILQTTRPNKIGVTYADFVPHSLEMFYNSCEKTVLKRVLKVTCFIAFVYQE